MSATLQIGRQPNKKFLDDEGNFCDEPYVEGLTEEDKVEDFDAAVYILNEKTQVCKLKTHCICLIKKSVIPYVLQQNAQFYMIKCKTGINYTETLSSSELNFC